MKLLTLALPFLVGSLVGAPVGPLSLASTPVGPLSLASTPALSDKDRHQADDERQQGEKAAADVAKSVKFVTDKAQVDRVNRIGQRLAAIANTTVIPAQYGNDRLYPFTWHFYVIKDKDVNAFSLPGGYVYINSGLLERVRSDDELAGVLGHEITHAAHHHIQSLSHEQSKMSTQMAVGMIAAVLAKLPPQDMANLLNGAGLLQESVMNLHFSQAAERDADHGGTMLMSKAGYNPVGMLTFMELLLDLHRRQPDINYGIYQNHPYEEERVKAIQTELAQMDVPVTPKAVRMVTSAARVALAPAEGPNRRLLFGDQTVATLVDPTGERAQAAMTQLNGLLDAGLQLYQVRSENAVLLVAERPILSFTPADAALQNGADPQSLAATACAALRRGLWAQTIKGDSPAY